MNLKSTTTVVALIASLTIILLWIIASPATRAKQPETITTQSPYPIQQRAENNVTIAVTPLALSTGSKPIFQVTFETHSVELDFDVPQIATLTDDEGSLYGIPKWEGSPPGGHHRNGTVSFIQPLAKNVKQITLTFTGIAGVPTRIFSWTL